LNNTHTKTTRTPKKRRKGINIFHILLKVKLAATEIAATIVFLVWLYRIFMHEIGR
jgi:hypothetical protein